MVEPVENAAATPSARGVTASHTTAAESPEGVIGQTQAARLAAIVWAGLAVGVVWIVTDAMAQGVTPAWDELALVGLLTGPLLVAAWALRKAQPRLGTALAVLGTLQLLAFASTATTALLSMRPTPLVDAELAAFDAWLGVDVMAWIAWAQQPLVDWTLWLIYHTLTPQTLLVVGLLVACRAAWRAWLVALQLGLAGVLTLVVFAMYPAVGPFATPAEAPTLAQQSYLEVFLALRSGAEGRIPLFVLTGLVTFPSFHAAWALVLTAAFASFRRMLCVIVPLNALVLVASVTHGCHYVADIAAGVGIGAVAIGLGWAVAVAVGVKSAEVEG